MALLRPEFEFQIQGPAISARAKNRQRSRERSSRVNAAARAAWPSGSSPMTGDCEVFITEFSEFATRDRANLAKPILDAMRQVAYLSDRRVKAVHVAWRDIGGSYIVRYTSPVVAAALSVGREFPRVRAFVRVQGKELSR